MTVPSLLVTGVPFGQENGGAVVKPTLRLGAGKPDHQQLAHMFDYSAPGCR